MNQHYPLVSVVIATRDRPELLRAALASVVEQDYPGDVEVVLVFDQSTRDESLATDRPGRTVRVVDNQRTPGLAGSRNTGIGLARGEWVAFLDDDDIWLPSKLRRQLDAAVQAPEASMVTCAIEVDYQGTRTARLAGRDRVTHQQLLRSRMSMLHSSTFLLRRADLGTRLALVDEDVPGSQNEDWDLLLRASALAPIVHVDVPLVVVLWGTSSFFSRTWETKVSSLHWMLEQHPDLGSDRKASARVYGQMAFGEAGQKHRREALRWAGRSLARHPLQWRAFVAIVVALGLVSADRVLDVLHRFGRGV